MPYRDTTVVFVPGGWHSPNSYDQVIAHLEDAGYNTAKVWTPSVLRQGGQPVESFDSDVAEIRKQIHAAVDAGQKVVVVMHSYGGFPASEAVNGYDQASMAAQGYQDGRGIIHMLYLAAFLLRVGEKWLEVPGAAPDWVDERTDGTIFPTNPADTFYHDFESKYDVDRWVADLSPWSPGVFASSLTYEPWKRIPSTYLACENDRAIPLFVQRYMVRNTIDAGAVDMRMILWRCGHTPFGVKPFETSQLIRAVACEVATTGSSDEKVL